MSNKIEAGWLFVMKDGSGSRALCKGRILFADCEKHRYLVQWNSGELCWYTSDWFPNGVGQTMMDGETSGWNMKMAGLVRYLVGQATPGDDEQEKGGYGPYYVSVDGGNAPAMQHSSHKNAKREAERIAGLMAPDSGNSIRIMKQVAVLKATPVTTYERKWV
ncbi:hypothetical protein LAh2_29 [Aeromonas phage LAh2]|uniref:Uncharacterized protein n=1 Tax=Aeromonas phage LAh1 TaxID=2591024 RepID=A0A513ZZ26_9CAUD|nr:hypothetical protein LAh1_30 [Aeromonas phage LAh1]QDH46303.1 hypothetical protein LAh2_29 [Aeromonas phage LAh2]QDH46348.1 hypothetical protein LAh3_34 [Aeromonas phage LAh3]QDH46398.1 hypothetical protein LAh4_36 [Aeromonas phage LAh4]QDH46451.1 hypothetical protein LAh5_37 [Aeromonas phage LAh5]